MVCSAWFRERLRKVSSKKENDMVQDIYSDEFDTPPACKPPLVTLKVRIKKDQDYRGYSDIIRIDKGDNNITFTSLYHESKESSDSLS